MAVFTAVKEQDLADVLERFSLGPVVSLREISEGIENTNYFLDTQDKGQTLRHWVLTLFENLDTDELPYFCALTQHLEKDGFAVPAPLQDARGESLFELNGRWAVIVPRLTGASLDHPGEQDCRAVGRWLAQMHVSLQGFKESRALVRDQHWVARHYNSLQERLKDGERNDLAGYLNRYTAYDAVLQQCPQGTVHGDLFRDNVLFDEKDDISGVIDFYHACDATLLFDLAVVANDWCTDLNGKHKKKHLSALVDGYQEVRLWLPIEHKAWPYALELAALRFWVSRLATFYQPGYQRSTVSGETVKDPEEMRNVLHGLSNATNEV